jgi:hypothetical protein
MTPFRRNLDTLMRRPEGPLTTRSRHLTSYRHSWANVCI